MSIYIIYAIFLLLFAVCLINTLTIRDYGCDKYVPYFLLMLLGNISYLISAILNIYTTLRHKIKQVLLKTSWGFLILGVCLKATFIIFSIVIYDRAYGDCYFPYRTQLIFMLGSFFEILFLLFLHSFWSNNEKNLKGIN